MAQQQGTKSPLHSFHAFTVKTLSPISSTSPKIRMLAHNYIIRHVCRVVRAIAYAKTMALELLNCKKENSIDKYSVIKLRRKKKKNVLNMLLRPCCIWSSSHVIPVSNASYEYYDPSWKSIVPTEGNDDMAGYLWWLEAKDPDCSAGDDGINDIDRLAEKFMLDKQKSFRRYQDMLARSM